MPSSDKDSDRSRNLAKGRKFEALAGEYFTKKGYTILETNWRAGRQEIDLIVQKGKTVVFVEVKSSSNAKYGHPAERVDQKKILNLTKAAQQYLLAKNLKGFDLRFDLVTFLKGQLEHYPNAFEASE
jgi:putative endonuclease